MMTKIALITGMFFAFIVCIGAQEKKGEKPRVTQENLEDWKLYKYTDIGPKSGYETYNNYDLEILKHNELEDEDIDDENIKGSVVMVSGDGFCSWAGIYKDIKVKGHISLKFKWRARSVQTTSSVTNAYLRILDPKDEKEYYSEALVSGGTLDSGWKEYKGVFSFNGVDEIKILLVHRDAWETNWDEKTYYTDIRVRELAEKMVKDLELEDVININKINKDKYEEIEEGQEDEDNE